MTYDYPVHTPESVAAQRLLRTLDDHQVAFAGAYHGWGSHEDGAAAGLGAVQRLGALWPSRTARRVA
jgi:predicted NAD/FAD-binding protein